MEEKRSFQEIITTVMEDNTWAVPKEEREIYLSGIAWTLLDL